MQCNWLAQFDHFRQLDKRRGDNDDKIHGKYRVSPPLSAADLRQITQRNRSHTREISPLK